jgi:PAS domain S-box-containing protein
MGVMMRAMDWAATPLGPVQSWPQSLRTTLSIMLAARYPMYVAWGPELIQFYNDAYRPILGANKHPAALDQALAFYAPESRPVIESAFSLCARAGTPFDVELELVSANGQRKWVRSIGQAERDKTGAIRRVHGAIQDITEQKKGLAALHVSEERFRLLSKATNDAIWDWNLATNQVWWNEGYEHLFGYARHETDPTTKSWTDHIHPEDLARVMEGIHRVIEHGGEAWSDEYRFRCKDGRYTHVLDRGHVIRDAAGKPVRMIGGMTDLTQLKEKEIALSQSNRALKMLSRCNEALIRSETENGLLADICQIAVDIGGFRLAWVGYALDDAQKTIARQSHAGIEDGYLTQARITWAENDPKGQGPVGKVIRHGEPVVIPDLETDEDFRPWLETARARGFRGVIALPLAEQNRTFGVFVLYQAEVRQPLPDEIRLLQELADDMAFGIVTIRTRLDRQRLNSAVAQVAASVSAATSTVFFEQLTRNMVTALGAKAGFVAKVLPGEPVTSRTIAVVVDDQITANFDYVLQGTPC